MSDRNELVWVNNPDIEGGPILLERLAVPFHAGYVRCDPPVYELPDDESGDSGQPTKAAKSADKSKEKQA